MACWVFVVGGVGCVSRVAFCCVVCVVCCLLVVVSCLLIVVYTSMGVYRRSLLVVGWLSCVACC